MNVTRIIKNSSYNLVRITLSNVTAICIFFELFIKKRKKEDGKDVNERKNRLWLIFEICAFNHITTSVWSLI